MKSQACWAPAAWGASIGRVTRVSVVPSPIKILDEGFSKRFEREARAIAALNHPNVCTLHDIGPNYLVMELVEGESLASQLRRGPLARDVVLQYSIQIAEALSAAHAKASSIAI